MTVASIAPFVSVIFAYYVDKFLRRYADPPRETKTRSSARVIAR